MILHVGFLAKFDPLDLALKNPGHFFRPGVFVKSKVRDFSALTKVVHLRLATDGWKNSLRMFKV